MKYEHVSVMFLTSTFQLIKDSPNWNLVFVQNSAHLSISLPKENSCKLEEL